MVVEMVSIISGEQFQFNFNEKKKIAYNVRTPEFCLFIFIQLIV